MFVVSPSGKECLWIFLDLRLFGGLSSSEELSGGLRTKTWTKPNNNEKKRRNDTIDDEKEKRRKLTSLDYSFAIFTRKRPHLPSSSPELESSSPLELSGSGCRFFFPLFLFFFPIVMDVDGCLLLWEVQRLNLDTHLEKNRAGMHQIFKNCEVIGLNRFGIV